MTPSPADRGPILPHPRALASGRVTVTTIRAGMVIGPGSAAFETILALVDRLPGMVCPRWVSTPTQPIAITDIARYIAGVCGNPEAIGQTLRTVPNVEKAVKWNSPFYGIEGQGWFLNFHCFTKYVKVAFFRGTSLSPLPPGKSKSKDARYLDIHENDQFDRETLASWIRQASALPGWVP